MTVGAAAHPGGGEPPPGPYPWGPKQVAIGAAAGLGVFILVGALVAILIFALDLPGVTEDIGGPFEKSFAVNEYAAEKLAALQEGVAVPEPPDDLLADIGTLRAAFGATVVQQALMVVVTVLVAGVGWQRFRHATGLHQFRWRSIWRPAVGAFGAWLFVAVYAIATQVLGIDLLIPQSTVPLEVQRDGITLAIVGVLTVIGAPLAEEFYFRGLVFGGLARWGFWPAALISGFVFSGIHLDPGSLIPFWAVGVILAWLYWHRGILWDALICHALFNAASFTFLALGAL